MIINGRPVRDPALLQAVLAAYRPLLPRDRFPLVVLAVSLAPADVDANVHPTKAWVRFRQPRVVQEMLVAATARGAAQAGRGPDVRRRRGHAATSRGPARSAGARRSPSSTRSSRSRSRRTWRSRFGRVLGQVQDTFIVSTTEDEVFFLDQHVVHERVVFEQVRGQLAAGPLASQSLLFPETLDLGPAARALLERWREPLERLGFGFEGFGGDAVVLRAVPTLLKGDEPEAPDRGRGGGAGGSEGRRARARPGAGVRGVPGGGEGEHAAGARGDGAAGRRP